MRRPIRRRTSNGTCVDAPIWSIGLPNRYLGMIHAPRRAARYVCAATKLASTAMSIAELPIPSTTTVLSRKKPRVVALVVVRVHLHALERVAPGKAGSGQRASQWWPLATSSAS